MELEKKMSSLRVRANKAQQFRCKNLVCVLENPSNLENVGSVVRNIDALGVTMLYVVSTRFRAEDLNHRPRNETHLNKSRKRIQMSSVSANKWVYIHHFETTQACIDHLRSNHFASLVTSPHIQGLQNLSLLQSNFTSYKKLAVWFGCEAQGISAIAIENATGCIQIEMCGIVESLNLSVSTGIILHFIASQRRQYSQQRKIARQDKKNTAMSQIK